MNLVNTALEYASRGWRVIPLFGVMPNGKCECGNVEDSHARSAGKHPRIKEWQHQATTDEDVIQGWWSRWPNSNLGVHMGEASGLVDIECDDDAAEQELLRLYDGNIPIVPTYQSARGKHRLFKWRPGLPNPDKAGFKIGTLEIQTGNDGGKQSVFPPSKRGDVEYKWLIHPEECDLGEISDELIIRMENLHGEAMPKAAKPKSERLKLYEQEAVLETVDGRDNVIYKEACHAWGLYGRTRGQAAFSDPNVFSHIFEQMRAWNLTKCRPPLSDEDVLRKVESARQFIQKEISNEVEERDGRKLAMYGLEWRDGEWWPGTWSITVILSEPPIYRLTVPAWENLIGHERGMELSAEQYRAAGAVAQTIFQATRTVIVDDRPGVWPAIWNGTTGNKQDKIPGCRGLKAKLLERAKAEDVPPEHKRSTVLAELLYEKIQKGQHREQPNPSGSAVFMPDDTIWIRWQKAWEFELSTHRVTSAELQKLTRSIGLTSEDSKRFPNSGASSIPRLRYFVLTRQHLAKLNALRGENQS